MRKIVFRVEENARPALQGLNLGHVYFSGVKNSKSNPMVDGIVSKACASVLEKFKGREISDDMVVKGVRAFFSKLDIDPTRYRPSGEALIRRVVSGKGIYRVNAVVDINNAVSLATGCPCGVYDAEKIEGDTITVMVGGTGQTYTGIGGSPVNGEGKILTADARGVFGGPTADSQRTCILPSSKEVLMLIYHPDSAPYEVLTEGISKAIKHMQMATNGKAEYSSVYRID